MIASKNANLADGILVQERLHSLPDSGEDGWTVDNVHSLQVLWIVVVVDLSELLQ